MSKRDWIAPILIGLTIFALIMVLSACGSDEEGGETSQAFPTVVVPVKSSTTTTCTYEYDLDELLVRSVCIEEQR